MPQDSLETDLEIADRIVARALEGVPDGRHIHANEVMPFIRAYVAMRGLAADAGAFMEELKAREMQGMGLHEG